MPVDIFLSVGRASTDAQKQFISKIEEYLRANGLTPNTLGRTQFTSDKPLTTIGELMRRCGGAVILAFERTYISEGFEHRGGGSDEKYLKDSKLTTVWNQIEAAMAYVRQQPLLVLVEEGVRREGLLEGSYDWFVQSIKLDDSTLATPEFVGTFNHWKGRVEAKSKLEQPVSEIVDPENLTVGKLISSMKMSHLWATGAAIVALLVGSSTVGFKVGSLHQRDTAKSNLLPVPSPVAINTLPQETTESITPSSIKPVDDAVTEFSRLGKGIITKHVFQFDREYLPFSVTLSPVISQRLSVRPFLVRRNADENHEWTEYLRFSLDDDQRKATVHLNGGVIKSDKLILVV